MKTIKIIDKENLFFVLNEVKEFLDGEDRLKMPKQCRINAKAALRDAAIYWFVAERNDEKNLEISMKYLNKAVFLIEKTGYTFK